MDKKFPNISTNDKLFKLCRYYSNHKDGPPASFDVDKFIKDYDGDII